MLIGFDGSRAFVKQKTGTENYSYYLLVNLLKIDTENRYLVYLRPGFKVVGEWPSNVEFVTINYSRLWTQVGLALQTFKDKLDVLFVPAHALPLIRKPGLKTVMTVHDLGAEYLPGMHQLKQALYLRAITKLELRGATRLIAVSKATKQDILAKTQIKSQKITVVYEGLNNEYQTPVENDVVLNSLKDLGISKGGYFLFVGTIQPRKNIARLIEAFSLFLRQSSSVQKLVLVGKAGWKTDDIYKLPQKLGIEDKVIFAGYKSDKEVEALMKCAKAFIFVSLFEGFGLPILEAFACSCPVLTSNISSMPEAAGIGAILVDPYSAQQIADGMIKVSDPKLALGLVKKGKHQLKKFSWIKAARETLVVLKEAANE